MNATNPNRIQAVENSFAILETLVEEDGATLAHLDRCLETSKSTIYHHLETLRDLGYVARRDEVYHVDLSLLTLGGYCRDSQVLYQYGRQFAEAAADATGEFAALTMVHRLHSIHLYRVEGENALPTDSYLGMQYKLHTVASGKAVMAHMPQDRIEEYVETVSLEPRTKNTLTDLDTLLEDLERIRERGFALDDGEHIVGLRGVAVPIIDRDTEEPLGALSIAGPMGRITDERFQEEIPEVLLRHVEMLEIQLAFS
jgi:DNA-binding IclR family transcriptional regulator